MKITHIIHFDGDGGGPRSVINLLRYFSTNYKQVVLHGGRGRIAEFCEAENIPHQHVALETKFRCLLGLVETFLWLKRGRPDIVVLHGQWAGPVGVLAAKLAGVRGIVYIARWPAFYTDWTLWRAVRNYFAEKLPCRLADRVVALTPSSRYQYLLRGWVPEDRLRMIPNAIFSGNIPNYDDVSAIRQRLGFKSDMCNVVTVGRLADQKRVEELLLIWSKVVERENRAQLWVVGSGPQQGKLMRLSEQLGLGEACVFTGMRSDATEFIAASDIFVLNSMYESFGNVTLEAMCCGKPVVVTRVDGLRDLVTDGVEGRLIDPWREDLFVEVLADLIGDPGKREAMGRQGRIRAREFSPETVFKAYDEMFVDFREGGRQ